MNTPKNSSQYIEEELKRIEAEKQQEKERQEKERQEKERQEKERQEKGLRTVGAVSSVALPIWGALLQDRAAEEEERKREQEQQKALNIVLRQDRQQAQQFERTAQDTDSVQNLQGIDMLADMRRRAAQQGIMRSMKNDFLRAMG